VPWLVVALVVSVGGAQALPIAIPDTILLPDSLGPLRPGYHLAFGSSTDNIYVASESSDILVVDGNTFQRSKRINTGTPVGGALLVSQHNKLYCSYPQQGRLGVVDCATNTVVGSVQVGTRPTSLCYSSGSDKLYCGDTIDCTVSVVDCSSNTVLEVVPVGESLTDMVYDPTTNKVYAATRDAVRAISCFADSVVATLSGIRSARCLCVHKRRQKLYALAGPYGETAYVVSTPTDSLIGAKRWIGSLLPRLACNEATDRLYAVGNDYYIYEFDCSGDTGTRSRDMSPYVPPSAIACDTVHNRLHYLSVGGTLVELDGTTMDFISETGTQYDNRHSYPGVLEPDPLRHRMMCACGSAEAALLAVFDHKSDSTYARGAVPLCGWEIEHAMSHNPATGRLYARWGTSLGGVGVIAELTNQVVIQAFLSQAYGAAEMAYSRTSNKFYFRGAHGLGVMDGAGDSLLGFIDIGDCRWDPLPCWCPDGNKVYCFAREGARLYVAVVDCCTDSVVRTIDVYDLVRRFEHLDDGRMLCNYGSGLVLIDCQTDSILVDSAIESPFAIAHTGDGEKTYLARNHRLEVRSSSSLSLLATIDWPYFDPVNLMRTFFVCSDTTRKLYWFAGDSVLAIDATCDTITARMATRVTGGVSLDHTGRYLFCVSYIDTCLRVYDTQSDNLAALYEHLPAWSSSVTANPEQRRIYVGCRDLILVYPDAPPGIEETPSGEVRAAKLGPTVVRGVLFLQRDRGPGTEDRVALLDIAGRVVMNLQPGANNVGHLGVGVYFIREQPQAASRKLQAARKIVIAE
jgi:hypothetical protein